MKVLRIAIILPLILISCKTARYAPTATYGSRSDYVSKYSDIAITEMRRTGIPASIKMAQAILESGGGNSTLARQGNNHFGIKCHEWTGRRIYHDDDKRNECFRRYRNPEDSFRDHSEFLTTRSRYASLFELDPYDYKAWARGLKAAGYATNPNYDRLLIRIIEENELYMLDRGVTAVSGQENATRVELRSEPAPSESSTRGIRTRNRVKYIIAQEGDTYRSITTEMGLMNWELSRYNDISASSKINAGDIIYLQPKRNRAARESEIHTLRAGENMHFISQLYGIKLSRLLRRNFMEYGQEPSPGDTIHLRRQKPVENRQRSLKPEFNLLQF